METVNGAAGGLRRTIQDIATRLGGSTWAKRCAVSYASQALRDIYQRRVTYTPGTELMEHWAFALDSEMEQAAKQAWDFFCHHPVKLEPGAMTGTCEAAGLGTIAFLNPGSPVVYLGTTYAVAAVVMSRPLAGKGNVFLTNWGTVLRDVGGSSFSRPTSVTLAEKSDPTKSLIRMAKELLKIELKGPTNA